MLEQNLLVVTHRLAMDKTVWWNNLVRINRLCEIDKKEYCIFFIIYKFMLYILYNNLE